MKRENALRKDPFTSRIHEIDFLRGILIFLVVFDHLMWCIKFYVIHNEPGFLTWYWSSELRFVVRQAVLMLFLFTCGVSCHFSRNNKKRGLMLLAVALLITLATHILQLTPWFANRVVVIDFNILGVIAISILLYVLCEKMSSKGLLYITGVLMVFYFFIIVSTRNASYEYNPFLSILYLPFNPIKEGYVGDYLPLFPYVIFLFFGVIFARKFYPTRRSIVPHKGNWEKPICFIGRHTLIIYLVHELVLTGLFMLISLML